jgi:hypothetical protein
MPMSKFVNRRRKIKRASLWAALFFAAVMPLQSVRAVEVVDFAVQVSAAVQTSPPKITLSWPQGYAVSSYAVSRKAFNSGTWTSLGALAGTATSFVDTNVSVGGAYEYRIVRTGSGYTGYGFCYAGINAPLTESRGKVLLLVDSTYAFELSAELSRLQQDLVGDGWTVVRKDVSRTATVASVKALIKTETAAGGFRSLFLFGRIPVPYSGNINPDGHADHLGAWPADVFYADTNGTWSDSNGDGIYDNSTLPSDVELEVGRVDLANMTSFTIGEKELLRRYLNKDHNFRHKLISVSRSGLVDDAFGNLYNEAFAANGWRNLAPMFGAANVIAADWSTLATTGRLWAYGCGAGSYTSCSGVTSTSSLASTDPKAVFTMLFGSYFGDWDSANDLLRAPLCTPTYGLTCAWAGGRPSWFFHHMALGETIGYSARLSQNNSTLYPAQSFARMIHVALMGDPTLRMHIVKPPANLTAVTGSGVQLSWSASTDPVLGYHIYRSGSTDGPFTRLNSALVTATTYTDASVSGGAYTYMVRAVALESSGSGSYYNASQGVFFTLGGGGGAPAVPLNLTGTGGNTQASLNWSASSGATSYNVKRATASGGPYTVVATTTANYYTNTGLANGTTYYYVCSALNASGESGNSNPVSVTPSASNTGGTLPLPWSDMDVGSVTFKGSATCSSDVFTVAGSGRYVYYSQDGFNFCYQPLNGDGQIVARVTGVTNTDVEAKAGVMIRETFDNNCRHAYLAVSAGKGVLLQRRTAVGGQTASTSGAAVKAPYWVKLVRVGNTFSAYQSADGATWNLVGSAAISMGASVYVGMAVTAQSYTALNTSTFDNVSVGAGTSGGGGGSGGGGTTPPVTAIALPAKIEAENFRVGGEGVGYHELTAKNYGGQGDSPVDMALCNDVGGGLLVGWIDAGEWLAYDISSATTASYNLSVRVATPGSSRKLHVEIDGVNVSGSVTLPNTGAYDVWGDLNINAIPVSAGTHVLKLVFDTGYFNVNHVTLSTATTAAAAVTAPLLASVGAAPNPATTGAAVSFYASAQDPAATLTYAWDFGDGATGTGTTPQHSYTSAGTHTIHVTASDGAGGAQTVTFTLTVNAP